MQWVDLSTLNKRPSPDGCVFGYLATWSLIYIVYRDGITPYTIIQGINADSPKELYIPHIHFKRFKFIPFLIKDAWQSNHGSKISSSDAQVTLHQKKSGQRILNQPMFGFASTDRDPSFLSVANRSALRTVTSDCSHSDRPRRWDLHNADMTA